MPSHTQYLAPLSGAPRPALPIEHINPFVKSLTPSNVPSVKFQEIIRDGQSTIVARMKVQTPTGHAFILRRLDTGAVSLTTMFRAAFPTASDDAEREESAWVKANYDVAGTNRSGKARFAGTWVSPAVALSISDAYSLHPVLLPLTEAEPDPSTEYRKSSRAQQQSPDKADKPPAQKQLPTPSPSVVTPNPAKRRREASPAPKTPAATPAKTAPTVAVQTATPNSAGTAAAVGTPALRRSGRTASPAPVPVPKLATAPKTPRSTLKIVRQPEPATPGGSDETAVDDEAPEIPGPDASQDIAEQKEMIESFKAQREKAQREQAERRDEQKQEQTQEPGAAVKDSAKRAREEEESLRFNFKEPQEPEAETRPIATNRRVRMIEMGPERKSFAWGIAAFAAAVGAMTYIPWF